MVRATSYLATALAVACASAAAIPATTTTYTAPSGPANETFSLIALAYAGDLKLSGMFPTPVHTGAGLNAMQAIQLGAIGGFSFNTTSGDIYTPVSNSPPYTLSYTGYVDFVVPGGLPAGYNLIGFNEGEANAGFSFNATSNEILKSSYKGKTLAVCPWVTVFGPAFGLMWRNESVKHEGCADVHLKALFESY